MARKRSKGVLSSIRAGAGKPSRRKKSFARRVGEWIVGGLALAALAVVLVMQVIRFVDPSVTQETREGRFAVVEVPEGENWVIVEIEGERVRLYLEMPGAPDPAEVREGVEVDVTYVWRMQSKIATPESWSLAPDVPDEGG